MTIRLSEIDRVVEALQRVQRARDAKNGEPQRRPAEHRERTYEPATEDEIERDRGLF